MRNQTEIEEGGAVLRFLREYLVVGDGGFVVLAGALRLQAPREGIACRRRPARSPATASGKEGREQHRVENATLHSAAMLAARLRPVSRISGEADQIPSG